MMAQPWKYKDSCQVTRFPCSGLVKAKVFCMLVFLAMVTSLLHGAVGETVTVNGNLYADTGKSTSSCTRHVTVEGEGDCYYSLKRLVSGTGVTNMDARGLFTKTTGEIVKYENADGDGRWTLTSVPKIGIAIANSSNTGPTSRLHVSGEIRDVRGMNLYPADQRLVKNIRDIDTKVSYMRTKQIKVRDFEYHPAYEAAMDMPTGGTVRSVLAQELGSVIPEAVRTLSGQESFGAPGTINGHVEVDAVQQVVPDRVFYDLLASFQELATRHEALQAQVNTLTLELRTFKTNTSDNFNAAKTDRSNLRNILSKTQSDHLADDTDLEEKIANERNARIEKDDAIVKQLDYVSQVFSTYTNY